MQIITNFLGRFVGFISTIFIMVGFSKLIKQMKKTNRMRARSHLMSIVFSVLMLVFNVLVLKGAKINLGFVLFLIFGAGFGLAWGKTTVLNIQEDKVIGKRSILYIYFWIASLAITQVLAFVAKANVVAIGLAGMFFSTGASLGTNSNILYRMKHLHTSSQNVSTNDKDLPRKTAKDKFCRNCGNPLEEEEKFCRQCGSKL